MILATDLYTDINIKIIDSGGVFHCLWEGKSPIHKSYMEAKLAEVIGNKFPGAWSVKDIKEADNSRGMRCFIMEWVKDQIVARWI